MRKQLKFKKNHSPNKRDEAVGQSFNFTVTQSFNEETESMLVHLEAAHGSAASKRDSPVPESRTKQWAPKFQEGDVVFMIDPANHYKDLPKTATTQTQAGVPHINLGAMFSYSEQQMQETENKTPENLKEKSDKVVSTEGSLKPAPKFKLNFELNKNYQPQMAQSTRRTFYKPGDSINKWLPASNDLRQLYSDRTKNVSKVRQLQNLSPTMKLGKAKREAFNTSKASSTWIK